MRPAVSASRHASGALGDGPSGGGSAAVPIRSLGYCITRDYQCRLGSDHSGKAISMPQRRVFLLVFVCFAVLMAMMVFVGNVLH